MNELKKAPRKKPGCFKTLIAAIGCSVVYIFLMTVVAVAFFWAFFSYPYKAFSTSPDLPGISLPEDIDFWNLQKLEAEAKSDGKSEITLTQAEYNAYLNKIDFDPTAGFCLQKVRYCTENGKSVFYFLGSGYMQRSMVIRMQYTEDKTSKGKVYPEKISFNSFQVTPNRITRNIALKILQKIILAGNSKSFAAIVLKNFPTVAGENIIIKLL